MEVNVTKLFEGHRDHSLDLSTFSSSVAESGLENIGEVTWRNACAYFEENDLLVAPENRDELESWLRGFGAWSSEEIEKMSDVEINALLLQFVAGDIQSREQAEERGELEKWEANDEGGRLYSCKLAGEYQWFFYVGD